MKRKNRNIYLILSTCVFITLFSFFLISINPGNLFTSASFRHTSERNPSNLRVAVFAGHGDFVNNKYQTYGKQSPTWECGLKVYEGRSTHDLALRLVLKLRDKDFDAQLMNPELEDISLHERVTRANTLYILDHRTISIFLHHNAQPTDSGNYQDFENLKGYTSKFEGGATGIEVFTSIGQTKSDVIAEYIIQELMNSFPNYTFRIDPSDGDLDKEANFYVLKNTFGPALLIEFLFMTTYMPDCIDIANFEIRELYLDAIVTALIKYSNEN
jgi:N-acetylmuramoyl-L-alanine amidase